ncbi:MAG: cyclodeaminase/cyclohydrolase family protein [Caldilineales bacterium]|nr:cyclodeaminase/cyclohydrolase family protein [Caldilineales bacterium]
MLKEWSLRGFLDDLADGTATPGGGAVAALNGAQAAALVSMVCRLTLGRKKYAAVAETIQGLLDRAEILRGHLLDLLDRDIRAYDDVMAAYRLPKDTEAQARARDEAIQQALREATLTPLATMAACVEVLEMCPTLLAHGNPNAASDAAAAAACAFAGLEIAADNVRINLPSITDAAFVTACTDKLQTLLAAGEQARQAARALAATRLGVAQG